MARFRILHYIPLFFLLVACSPSNELNQQPVNIEQEGIIYWVNSAKVECMGVVAMACLQVQTKPEKSEASWQLFYDDIDGFDYQPGYIYKLLVKEEKRTDESVPADASSIKYSLLKIMSKEVDQKMKLNGVWLLEGLKDQKVSSSDYQKKPQLQIDLEKKRVSGNDSCNQFFAEIKSVTSNKLILGPLASTRMLCMKMDIADSLGQQMKKVVSYKINDARLTLLDKQGQTRVSFIKQK